MLANLRNEAHNDIVIDMRCSQQKITYRFMMNLDLDPEECSFRTARIVCSSSFFFATRRFSCRRSQGCALVTHNLVK